jgi:propionyl-CoA carboxylase beta chain
MGAEGAVNILYHRQIDAAADPEAERASLVEEYRRTFGPPYYAARAGYVDDIIEPRETRPKLIAALAALRDKQSSGPARKHGNMPM